MSTAKKKGFVVLEKEDIFWHSTCGVLDCFVSSPSKCFSLTRHQTNIMSTEMNVSDASANAATVVVVERDYSHGLTPQFDTKVPRELQDRITQDEFARIVEYVNMCISDSDRVTCGSACENITAYLTCFLSLLFCKTHSQRVCFCFSPLSPFFFFMFWKNNLILHEQ